MNQAWDVTLLEMWSLFRRQHYDFLFGWGQEYRHCYVYNLTHRYNFTPQTFTPTLRYTVSYWTLYTEESAVVHTELKIIEPIFKVELEGTLF